MEIIILIVVIIFFANIASGVKRTRLGRPGQHPNPERRHQIEREVQRQFRSHTYTPARPTISAAFEGAKTQRQAPYDYGEGESLMHDRIMGDRAQTVDTKSRRPEMAALGAGSKRPFSPDQMRRAVVMSEILGKPVSMRRRYVR